MKCRSEAILLLYNTILYIRFDFDHFNFQFPISVWILWKKKTIKKSIGSHSVIQTFVSSKPNKKEIDPRWPTTMMMMMMFGGDQRRRWRRIGQETVLFISHTLTHWQRLRTKCEYIWMKLTRTFHCPISIFELTWTQEIGWSRHFWLFSRVKFIRCKWQSNLFDFYWTHARIGRRPSEIPLWLNRRTNRYSMDRAIMCVTA